MLLKPQKQPFLFLFLKAKTSSYPQFLKAKPNKKRAEKSALKKNILAMKKLNRSLGGKTT